MVSSGASLFCFQITAFLLRPLRAFPPCVSSTYDDTSHVGLGHTTLKASLNLNYLFKDSLSKYNHILRYWCLGLQHMDFSGKLWSIKLLQKTIFYTVGTACTQTERGQTVWYILGTRLPRWHSGKESACQCRRCKRCRFDPGVGKIPWRRK